MKTLLFLSTLFVSVNVFGFCCDNDTITKEEDSSLLQLVSSECVGEKEMADSAGMHRAEVTHRMKLRFVPTKAFYTAKYENNTIKAYLLSQLGEEYDAFVVLEVIFDEKTQRITDKKIRVQRENLSALKQYSDVSLVVNDCDIIYTTERYVHIDLDLEATFTDSENHTKKEVLKKTFVII